MYYLFIYLFYFCFFFFLLKVFYSFFFIFFFFFFFFSSRRRHTRSKRDWSSDVCSSDLSCCATRAAGATTCSAWPRPGRRRIDANARSVFRWCGRVERHECQTRHADPQRLEHRGELRLVREARLEKGVGLGRPADLRRRLLRQMRRDHAADGRAVERARDARAPSRRTHVPAQPGSRRRVMDRFPPELDDLLNARGRRLLADPPQFEALAARRRTPLVFFEGVIDRDVARDCVRLLDDALHPLMRRMEVAIPRESVVDMEAN